MSLHYKYNTGFNFLDKFNNLKKKKIYFPRKFLEKVIQKKAYTKKQKLNLPKISIVMTSLNQSKFIERSILSILNQKYPKLQFIIIDGGSNDSTVKIIKKYSKYIDFWVSEKDQGQSDALNKGFKRANGEIYGWLNSDDLYLPNAFFTSVFAFKNHPKKSVIFGDWLFIDENNATLDFHHAFDFNLNHFKYEGFHLSAQSMFWRSNLHKKFKGFNLNLYNTMDYQMILEFGLLAEKKFFRIPSALGAFRRHKNQKTGNVITPRILQEHAYLANEYNYSDKYTFVGYVKRFYFRFRRVFWYVKRGGIGNLLNRFLISLKYKLTK
jgi:glycosyltransferase involved in cell wall biosynthesis